jgi:GNAT superfamily N-acetyltransferase
MLEIRRLSGAEARANASALGDVLLDCVQGGASVSFMDTMTKAEADAFFKGVAAGVEKGERILLAAFLDSRLVGTVQVVLSTPPNQPHRADVAKMLVHRSARRNGVGQRLIEEAEAASLATGKWLLVLDTVTGDTAERLYSRAGWTKSGIIPNYALYPDGRLCATTVFYKQLKDPANAAS